MDRRREQPLTNGHADFTCRILNAVHTLSRCVCAGKRIIPARAGNTDVSIPSIDKSSYRFIVMEEQRETQNPQVPNLPTTEYRPLYVILSYDKHAS
jgi:hypothetical protein